LTGEAVRSRGEAAKKAFGGPIAVWSTLSPAATGLIGFKPVLGQNPEDIQIEIVTPF